MAFIRWIFGLFITLLILLAVAVVVIPQVVDPNEYRQEITQLVKDQTGRELVIDGKLKLSVFPKLGVSTGKLRFSHPNHLSADFGGGNMLEVDAAKVHLKVMPLLNSINREVKDIQIDTIVLQQPQVEIITLENGINSLTGLAGEEEKQAAPSSQDQKAAAVAGVALVVQGVDLQSGRLVWDDRQAGQRYELRNFNVNTGNLLGETLAKMVVSGEVLDSQSPDITQFNLQTQAKVDVNTLAAVARDMRFSVQRGDLAANASFGSFGFQQNAKIAIQQLAANVSMSDQEIGPVDMNIAAPAVSFDQASQVLLMSGIQAQGSYQKQPIKLDAQDIQVDLKQQIANLSSLEASVDALRARLIDVQAKNFLRLPQGSAKIEVPAFDARPLLERFEIDAKPSKPTALSSIAFSADISGNFGEVSLTNLKATVDDSELSGFVSMTDFQNPTADFDLTLNQLNVDEYLPEPQENQSSGQETTTGADALFVPLSLFEKFKANGKFKAGQLIASGVKVEDISVNVVSDDTSTTITPDAKLYDGSFDGQIRYQQIPGGARLTVDNDVNSVNLGNLLIDADITDQLSGIGSLGVQAVIGEINGQQTNRGVVSLGAKDGAIKGVDIQKMLKKVSNAYNQLKGREIEESADQTDETRFASLGGTFKLNDYQIDNLDFNMKAPLFRIGGEGNINLQEQVLDYTVKVSVVNSLAGQGGEGLEKLKGITLPVRFTGPLTSPKYRIDMKALVKSAVDEKIDQKKDQLIKKRLGIEGGGKLRTKDILKAAIGKKLQDKYGSGEDTQSEQTANQQTNQQQASDLNQAPQQQSQQPRQQAQPKSKAELKQELKDEAKRKLLESLFGK